MRGSLQALDVCQALTVVEQFLKWNRLIWSLNLHWLELSKLCGFYRRLNWWFVSLFGWVKLGTDLRSHLFDRVLLSFDSCGFRLLISRWSRCLSFCKFRLLLLGRWHLSLGLCFPLKSSVFDSFKKLVGLPEYFLVLLYLFKLLVAIIV